MPTLPESLARACSADLSTFTLLGNSQNVVFEFRNRWGEERILRLSAHSHRTDVEIAGELAWVHHLHDQGRRVCPAIPFADGELIRPLKFGGEPYNAVIFERAKGKPVERSDFGDDLSFRHGEALGSIHATTFQLVGRKQWPLERYFGPDIEAYVPDSWRATVWERCRTLLEEAQATTGPPGPLHFDLGYSNFFLDDGRPTVFDFDNCAEGPLVADVAAALYGSIFTAQRRSPGADRSCFAHPQTGKNLESVWAPFVDGYRSKSTWPQEWTSQLPTWFQVLYLRSVVHAFRLLSPLTPPIAEMLAHDVAHLDARTMPLNFDFHAGLAMD